MAIERLHTIKNFHEISPELGTAGQPSPEQFADIAEAGYEFVINIDSATAVPNEDLNALWEPNDVWQEFIDQAVNRLG